MARCGYIMKADKAGNSTRTCIVPAVNGKHSDGNPDHYNGSSHWTNAGWVRG